jgi:hypothetical protein
MTSETYPFKWKSLSLCSSPMIFVFVNHYSFSQKFLSFDHIIVKRLLLVYVSTFAMKFARIIKSIVKQHFKLICPLEVSDYGLQKFAKNCTFSCFSFIFYFSASYASKPLL